MFDVGFAEIFLLSLIGLLVLGPERLPAVARTVGGFMRKARASWASMRATIESELAEADIAAPLKQAQQELNQIGKDLKSELPEFPDLSLEAGSKPISDADIKAGLKAKAKQQNTGPAEQPIDDPADDHSSIKDKPADAPENSNA